MPTHSICRIWAHVIWGTKNRAPSLRDGAAERVSELISKHAVELGVELRSIHVNEDHVHLLMRLPSQESIADVVRRLKGRSSRIASKSGVTDSSFGWAVGYAAFSVSVSNLDKVAGYIGRQAEHHRKENWREKFDDLLDDFDIELPSPG